MTSIIICLTDVVSNVAGFDADVVEDENRIKFILILMHAEIINVQMSAGSLHRYFSKPPETSLQHSDGTFKFNTLSLR